MKIIDAVAKLFYSMHSRGLFGTGHRLYADPERFCSMHSRGLFEVQRVNRVYASNFCSMHSRGLFADVIHHIAGGTGLLLHALARIVCSATTAKCGSKPLLLHALARIVCVLGEYVSLGGVLLLHALARIVWVPLAQIYGGYDFCSMHSRGLFVVASVATTSV